MSQHRSTAIVIAAGVCFGVLLGPAPAASADIQPHPAMLRYPDVSRTQIVLVYANDLWLVSRDGGQATPLASPPGPEGFPKFSPDGETIAFIGNYDGNRDLYTIPRGGGVPVRVTHHPGAENLCGWTPEGQLLYFSNGLAGLRRQQQAGGSPIHRTHAISGPGSATAAAWPLTSGSST